MCANEFKVTVPNKKICSEKCAKERAILTSAEWRKNNKGYYIDNKAFYKEKYKKNKFAIIEKKYGLTEQAYNEMWSEQSGRCKICNKHEQELGKVLYVDHCHNTGKVRGLLCNKCNTAIGLLFDDVDIILKAANYIKENL
jgi:hypothetical protein